MKTIKFKINVPKHHRMHSVLFDNDLPFKPKIENKKKSEYARKPKYRKNFDFFEV